MIEFCPSKFELQFLKITVVISFFFVVLLPRGDTSDSVPFADMIPQIHFCYLNCHTDTFNQLLHLRVSRLRSSISYHPCPKCNIRMEFCYLKADKVQIAPCIDSYYFNTLQIIDLIHVANCNVKVRTNYITRSWSDVCPMKPCHDRGHSFISKMFFMYFEISMN